MSKDAKSNIEPAPAPSAGSSGAIPSPVTMVTEVFGVSRPVAIAAISAVVLLLIGAVYYFVRSAPPTTIVITSGPEGSIFQTNA
ncbi:MAG: hypothetical protein ABSG14_15490, partial [Verrucomicrobiia bacterium]